MSVGHLNADSTLAGLEVLDQETLDALQKAGAVGDFFCRFIDKDGQPIDHPINERVIAVDIASVRAAKKKILASGGAQKRLGVAAALKVVKPTVIITDETVAEYLMTDAA